MRIINENSEVVSIDSLRPHPRNVNMGDIGAIHSSITANGFYGNVVAQRSTGHILAGSHRWLGARQAGLEEIPVTWVDVDDAAALRIMLADNRTARLGSDDEVALAELLQELANDGGLEGTGFDGDDLDQLLDDLGRDPLPAEDEADEPDVDRAGELRQKYGVSQGQIWQVGRHKVLCGDSLDPVSFERLTEGAVVDFIYSDPPYGVKIVASNGFVGGGEAYDIPFGGVKNRGRGSVGASKPFGSQRARGSDGATNIVKAAKYLPIKGDETTGTAVDCYVLLSDLYPKAVHVWWGANYYADALPPSACWLIWDKDNTGNFADAELAWTNQKTAVRIFRHRWNGMLRDSERGKRMHPTQKPAALAQWAFEKYGKKDMVMLDPFTGAGGSLVAAEQFGCTGLGVEYEADYVAVIIQRLADLTDLEPVLLNQAQPADAS